MEVTLRTQAEKCLAGILADLEAEVDGQAGLTLGNGLAGLILLHANLQEGGLLSRDPGRLERMAVQAHASLGHFPAPALYSGWLGFAWIAAYLRNHQLLSLDGAFLGQLDRLVLQHLGTGYPLGHDLISGLTGLGVYGLERMRTAAGRARLDQVHEALVRGAALTPEGTWCWVTTPGPHEDVPGPYLNLGVAHGMAAILAFFAKYYRARRAAPAPRYLATLRWLAATAKEGEGANLHPPWITLEGACGSRSGRVTWCNGDLGLAVALALAGTELDLPEIRCHALAMADRIAAAPIEHTGLDEPVLCHGFAGNALLFHRLWRMTGEPRYLAQAEKDLRRILDKPEALVSGSLPIGLLMGRAGIALVLATCLSDRDTRWERVMMMA